MIICKNIGVQQTFSYSLKIFVVKNNEKFDNILLTIPNNRMIGLWGHLTYLIKIRVHPQNPKCHYISITNWIIKLLQLCGKIEENLFGWSYIFTYRKNLVRLVQVRILDLNSGDIFTSKTTLRTTVPSDMIKVTWLLDYI